MKNVILFKRASFLAVSLLLALSILAAAFPTPAMAQGMSCANTYRVKPGDTRGTVAYETGMKWAEIAALNNLEPEHKLLVGQALCYNKKAKPAAALTAAVIGNKVRVTSKNAADDQTYLVRARDAGGGDWSNLGRFKAYETKASQTSFPLPDDLKGIFPLAVCLKNLETAKLTCLSVAQ
jgi:hypothetical protein